MSDAALNAGAASVAKVVDEDTLVINRGLSHGVKVGSKFLIYGIGDEIVDPETDESLGQLELVRGIGVVVHVQDKLATLRSTKTRSPSSVVKRTRTTNRYSISPPVEEIIEEKPGEPEIVPFEGAERGDRARPI